MLKYLNKPLSENNIFLSCASDEIKWKDLDANLDAKVEILKRHGIGPHVVFIIAEDIKSIDDFLWTLAIIKNGGAISTASSKQSQLEINTSIKDSEACCVIRSNNIEMLYKPKESTVMPYEIHRAMTSGTTVKPLFKLSSYYWDAEDHLRAVDSNGITPKGGTVGHANNSLYKMAPEFKHDKRPICLSPGHFDNVYTPWNLFRMYWMGGRLHFLNEDIDDIPKEIKRIKPNFVASFPNAMKRIVDACPDNFSASIDYWEFAGGRVSEKVIYDINQKFKFKILYNYFGSNEHDMLVRSEYRPGDPLENFYGFRFGKNDYYGELKIDNDGILWYKFGNRDWSTEGDKMKVDGDRWYYEGRVFDDMFFVKNGVKIYAVLAEAKVLELPGVEEVSSVGKDKLHFLIYTGTTDINELHKHLLDLQPYKRPHDIYHVTDKLYFGGEIKLQKRRLPELLEKFPEEILNTVNVKAYNEI